MARGNSRGLSSSVRTEVLGRSLEIPKNAYKKPLSGYTLIQVSPKQINDLHLKTNPDWSVKGQGNQIGNRVESSKNYILNKKWSGEKAEAPRVGFTEDGKLSIADGRHRLLASEELGILKTFVQVPAEQAELFKNTVVGVGE